MHVLITGAAGFVGSHLCEVMTRLVPGCGLSALVRPGRDVSHLVQPGLNVVECDMDSEDKLRACLQGVDTVVHLAGVTMARDRQGYVRGNAHLTAGLVRAVNDSGQVGRFVYVSSQAAAGPSHTPPGLLGHEMPLPVSWYGQSKLQAEHEVSKLACHRTIIRPPMIYGPRDVAFLPLFRAARLGIVPLQDRGRAPMSIAHVRDVCTQIVAAMTAEQPSGRIYYPSDGVVRTWKDICLAVIRGSGCRASGLAFPAQLILPVAAVNGLLARMGGPVRYLNPDKYREARQKGWLCSGDSAMRDLGWRPDVDLEQGMHDTAAWYRRQGWLKDPLSCWPWW